jgi:transposase
MAGGRPTKFTDDMVERVVRLCRLGLTNEELATSLDVSKSTIDKWIKEKEEFSSALKAGREESDSLVAKSLFEKAISGDTTACIFWLKNRRQFSWRDKHEVESTSTVKHVVSREPLTDEEWQAKHSDLETTTRPAESLN